MTIAPKPNAATRVFRPLPAAPPRTTGPFCNKKLGPPRRRQKAGFRLQASGSSQKSRSPKPEARSLLRHSSFVIRHLIIGVLALPAAAAPDYDRDVRPVLSDNCYQCHGPDAPSRQAELRLDTREGILESVVVPGKPDDSELIARITSTDPDVRMPPPDSNLKLTAAEKQLLREWIAAGAAVTEHWSFRPLPDSVAVPQVRNTAWPRGLIDRFILARLEAREVQPSPPAEPWRILRRVTLDLTGLPPTPDEIKAFEFAAAENFDAALAQVVDRLLASPAFGEHLAVAWLDLARYADSYGYQSDQLNTQWPYRDWVVRAINDNLPYDQFLAQQLAGDLLPHATREQILATAFNRMHRMTNEGGSIAEEWLVENAADRVHTMGSAMLGLTLECARCHDHKFDPILARDYYSLMAFFDSIDENGMYDNSQKVPSPSLLLPTPEQEKELAAAQQKIAEAEAALAKTIAEGADRFNQWLAAAPPGDLTRDRVGHFTFDDPADKIAPESPRVQGVHGQAMQFDGDHGAVFPDLLKVDRWDAFSLDFQLRDEARNPLPVVVAQATYGTDVGYNGFDLMLEDGVLTARFYRIWPGNAIGIQAARPLTRSQWQHVCVTYDGSSRAAGLKLYLDGEELPTKVLRDHLQKSASVALFGAGHLTFGERFRDRGFKDGQLDELSVYRRALTPLEVRQLNDGDAFAAAAAAPEASRDALRSYYFSALDDPARAAADALREARRRFVVLEDQLDEASVMGELPEPRPTYVLARGAYDAPRTAANRVGRDVFQQILGAFPTGAPRNRLGLAEWMTDPRHPLTARVAVNRMWSNFFGLGLVPTPENFGRQGVAPTHPELLDWLARDFVAHGWDVKRLCRQIALSAAYRQESRATPELRSQDPDNRWLARGPSRRLSAEQVRDLALAASGLLDRTMGGPPVSPYQPGEDLWREANSMSPPYRQSTGKGLYRRSLYSVWKRTAPLPNMMAFDSTTREVCVVSRSRTNTPLQALVLLNDVQFVEAARNLATRVMAEHADKSDQIAASFVTLTGRRPDEVEAGALSEVYDEQRALFADATEQDAAKFLALGESKAEPTGNPADLAALTATCQAILNLDATITER